MTNLSPSDLLPLKVQNLCFERKNHKIIKNISFEANHDGITLLIGPNGAGKTLTLYMIHGLLTPTSGKIRWGNKKPDIHTRKRQSMLFQNPVLLKRSVGANIDMILKQRKINKPGLRDQLLDQARLLSQAKQPATSLSGGEKKRLALIRAIATNPDILLLDEPTANLDPASIFNIENMIMEIRNRGIKIFLVSHDIGQGKRLANHVIFLHKGIIREQSVASSFFQKPQNSMAQDYLDGKIIL